MSSELSERQQWVLNDGEAIEEDGQEETVEIEASLLQQLQTDLVTTGHARVFDSTFSQSTRFYEAEANVQEAQTGLWDCRSHQEQTPTAPSGDSDLVVATINADAPGNGHENLNGEYIVFRNAGETTLDLTGWTVADEADHSYQFPTGFTLAPGGGGDIVHRIRLEHGLRAVLGEWECNLEQRR
jgi:micrococcal nuclease